MDVISLVVGLVVGGVLTYVTLNILDQTDGQLGTELITNADAIRHINNYTGAQEGDPRSGHFPLDQLMVYIAQMKKAAENTTKDVAGLEIYLARYDATDTDNPSGLNYVIYPTYLDQDAAGNDIYIPFDPVSSNAELVRVIDLIGKTTFNNNRSALNKSNMSPPRRFTWIN